MKRDARTMIGSNVQNYQYKCHICTDFFHMWRFTICYIYDIFCSGIKVKIVTYSNYLVITSVFTSWVSKRMGIQHETCPLLNSPTPTLTISPLMISILWFICRLACFEFFWPRPLLSQKTKEICKIYQNESPP